MTNSYSANTLEERLVKLERKNKYLSFTVVGISLVFPLILLAGAGNKTFNADEIKCKLLRADQILLVNDILETEHKLDGNSWMISGKRFRSSGGTFGVTVSESTGKDSYVLAEYGNHGFRMSSWDGNRKSFLVRLGDTYPSGNGLGALEIFNGKGNAYFSVLNGKVSKEELTSAQIEENAARHKKKADDQRDAVNRILEKIQPKK